VRVETNPREQHFDGLPAAVRLAEELGFDGVTQSEIRRDPFLSLGVAATVSTRVRLTPSVAIVFPRSPMIVAVMSHNLQELSHGRFVLGMGTQVKGHIQRRFSMEWGRPGPRMREYILALRAIWDTFQHNTPLEFEGEFYRFTLMNPEFNPGPSESFPIPVQIAAINQFLCRTAGELCDGLRVHGFTTPEYLRDVIWPNVIRGAQKSGRSLDGFEMVGAGFIATGPDEETVTREREKIRTRVAWYGSTRTYLPVLEHHGWEGLNPEMRKLIDAHRLDELHTLIDDTMLDTFCVAATWADLPDALDRRIGGLTDSISIPVPESMDNYHADLAELVSKLQQLRRADRFKQLAAVDAAD
jgi:probable F420-dependent oxidoreductase